MNASSLTRFSSTSSSAERLIRIVKAFFAIGYATTSVSDKRTQMHIPYSQDSNDPYCIIASQELQVAHWEKLVTLEKVRFSR